MGSRRTSFFFLNLRCSLNVIRCYCVCTYMYRERRGERGGGEEEGKEMVG